MPSNNTPQVPAQKTPQQLAEELRLAKEAEDKKKADEEAKAKANASGGAGGDFFSMISDFLKMILAILFPEKKKDESTGVVKTDKAGDDAYDGEEQTNVPITAAEKVHIGRIMIENRVATKWNDYKQKHAGEKVVLESPVEGESRVTSGFGHREAPKAGASTEHAGLDLVAANGSDDILAAASGFVLFSGKAGNSGNTVILGHADGTSTVYRHLTGAAMPMLASVVEQGDVIGHMGATGNVTGKHLHFEVRDSENHAIAPKIDGEHTSKGSMIAASHAPAKLPVMDVDGHSGPSVASAKPKAADKSIT